MEFGKCRLWMTINSLETIPSIDNRLLYADVLSSLDNNIYSIKQVRIPELYNVYQRDYDDLKQLLYYNYLKIIKDTEAGLADLIIQDLYDKYHDNIVETFNIYTMYGGGDGEKMPELKTQEEIDAFNAYKQAWKDYWKEERGISDEELAEEGFKNRVNMSPKEQEKYPKLFYKPPPVHSGKARSPWENKDEKKDKDKEGCKIM